MDPQVKLSDLPAFVGTPDAGDYLPATHLADDTTYKLSIDQIFQAGLNSGAISIVGSTLTIDSGVAGPVDIICKGNTSNDKQQWLDQAGAVKLRVTGEANLSIEGGLLRFGADAAGGFGPYTLARAVGSFLINAGPSGVLINNDVNTANLAKVNQLGKLSLGTAANDGQLQVVSSGAATSIANFDGAVGQTAPAITVRGHTTTTAGREMGTVDTEWVDDTEGSQKASLILSAWGTTRFEGMNLSTDGSQSLIGFYGEPPVAQSPAVTAPAGGVVVDVQARAAIVSLIAILSAAGGGVGITA